MPSADQVPVKSTHSMMLWPEWVVLIAGTTGSALRAVRPPNRHITPDVRHDLIMPRARRVLGATQQTFTDSDIPKAPGSADPGVACVIVVYAHRTMMALLHRPPRWRAASGDHVR